MSPAFLVLTGLAVVAAGLWLMRRGTREREPAAIEDPDELDAAEREVRDLDAFTSPEDADEQLPDWGPGAS